MVALLTPARSATASMLTAERPRASSSSAAASRIASRAFSLRGRPRRGASAVVSSSAAAGGPSLAEASGPSPAAAGASLPACITETMPLVSMNRYLMHLGNDRGNSVERLVVPRALGTDQGMLDAEVGQFLQVVHQPPQAVAAAGEVGHRRRGLLDLIVVAADLLAVVPEHAQFGGQNVGKPVRHVEQVAGVAVLSDQPERAALAAAADPDRGGGGAQ